MQAVCRVQRLWALLTGVVRSVCLMMVGRVRGQAERHRGHLEASRISDDRVGYRMRLCTVEVVEIIFVWVGSHFHFVFHCFLGVCHCGGVFLRFLLCQL